MQTEEDKKELANAKDINMCNGGSKRDRTRPQRGRLRRSSTTAGVQRKSVQLERVFLTVISTRADDTSTK
jgi:hypothetical protein